MKIFNQPGIKKESGIVSLIVVSILAIVLGLVAIGFSQLTNRELKQASDRELDAQAFYAAESGINDAIAYLNDPNATFPLNGCDDWKTSPVGPKYFATDLSNPNNPAGNAKYTCVIIDNKTPNLVYRLGAGQSVTIKINQPALAKLFLGWENQGQSDTGQPLSATFGNLPQESSLTNQTGVLKTAVYGVSSGCTSNDCLSGLSRNYFMYPDAAKVGVSNAVAFSSGYNPATGPSSPNGSFVHGECKTNNPDPNIPTAKGRYCESVITGLNGPAPTYYVQLTALYTDMNVTLWGKDSGGNAITFAGTQGSVDVTGKGADVLQRIRARVDIGRDYLYPDFALQSMEAICKGFTVDIPSAGTYGSTIDNSSMPNPDGSCAAPADSGGTAPGGGLTPH